MRYKMKIAQWIRYMYFGLMLYMVGMSVFLLMENEPFAAIIMIPVIILIVSLQTHAYYVLEDDHIFMRTSFFFKRIKYEDVIELSKVRRWKKQNFAMDPERIVIKVRNKSPLFAEVDISPMEMDEVMDELLRRCRNVSKGDVL